LSTSLSAIGLVVFATFIGAVGAVYFKFGAKKLSFIVFDQLKNWELMLGVLFYGLSTVFFIWGLKGGELTVLYPFVALTYVWVIIFSVYWLKEIMNMYKWLGIAGILIGVILIGLGGG